MLDQLDPVVRDATDPLQAEDDAVEREMAGGGALILH